MLALVLDLSDGSLHIEHVQNLKPEILEHIPSIPATINTLGHSTPSIPQLISNSFFLWQKNNPTHFDGNLVTMAVTKYLDSTGQV